MSRPLVSVITPTWDRPDLLAETIEHVRAQRYRPLEHIIISDGQDERVADLLIEDTAEWYRTHDLHDEHLIRWYELGRNWSSYLPDSFCAAPAVVGMLMARGEYQTFLADDERMAPDHIESLVDALEAAGADFAYSKVRLHWVGQHPARGFDIGQPTPALGQITNMLWRADLLKRGLYPFGAGMTSDWACVKQWMDAGATWAFVDRVTLTHRADH